MKIFSDDTIKDYSNTIGEWNEVDKTVHLPLFVQAILGQNVLDPNWNWKNRILKQIFSMFLIIYVILGTKDYLKDATDITTIGEGYFTMLITSLFYIKYLVFVSSRGTFRTLYLIAKTSLLEMVEADSIEKSKELLKKMRTMVNMLFAAVLFPVIMYLLVAIWNYILGTRVTLSKTTSILMPMTSPYYEIGLLLHTIFLFYVAFTLLVIDMWFVLLMSCFCMASDSLVKMLRVEPKTVDETDVEYGTRLNDTLRAFYKNHDKLMEYLNILSKTYKWPAVVPLVTVLLAFCLILFLVSENVQWTFLANLLAPLMEIFAYSWFGEQVKAKGIDLNRALLNFDWTSMSGKDKKNYLIIITYMTKEFRIKTAVGNDLSLFTMSSVLKASYQAFAVLKSMET